MKSVLHLVILSIYLTSTNSYLDFNNLRHSLIAQIQRYSSRKHSDYSLDKYGPWVQEKEIMRAHPEDAENGSNQKLYVEDRNDVMKAHEKALVLSKAKGKEAELNELNVLANGDLDKVRYHMDPVFDVLRSGRWRRNLEDEQVSSSDTDSSTAEKDDFKEQFRNQWLKKKYEALNSSVPPGDDVNMVAARPWGVQCGDPNQHDMPWGSCMLSMECEPEYRIYRGDIYCGRTSFVCCALEVTTYDMYQGFDVSFDDKSLSTDSEEIKHRGDEKKKKTKDRKRRKDARARRKKKIKSTIKKIMKEINTILSKIYQNSTKQKSKKTRQMKKFIKKLKQEYKKDRLAVIDLHEEIMIKIDAALMKKLYQIRDMNTNFMKNATFANIVVNGTMSKEGARMLIQAYPELETFINDGRRTSSRKNTPDYLEYDVEYGFLYY